MSEPEDDGPLATAQIKLASAGEKLPGTPYELGERLGGGGMGQVFRARHIELGRDVAVKLLAPALAHDPKAMERLRREARAAARLGNPHIIEIYDLGISDDGRPYVVMKLVDGRDLKKLLDAEAPLPPERVYGIIGQIGDALADAHAAGVVHRDLKPENVLVERRQGKDRVTLLDFGIAQSIQDTDSRLTREGQMIGTPGYMAPEQALARPLDGRADQYAVAVIAYEMLSGKSPFARITALQLLAAQLTQAPTPLGEVVDPAVVPPALQAVVMRGLERDPDARFVDMPAFVEAFGAALETPAAPVSAPAGMGRGPMIAAAVLAVALIGLGTWFWRRAGQPTTPTVAGSANAAATNAVTPPVVPPVAQPSEPVDAAAVVTQADQAVLAPADAGAAVAKVDAAPPAPPPAPRPEPPARDASVRAARPATARVAVAPRPPVDAAVEPPAPTPPVVDAAPPPPAPPPEPVPVPAAPPVAAPPPPAAPARLVFGELEVEGGASTRAIRRTIQDAFPAIRRCASAGEPRPAGAEAKVSFVIDADGFFGDFGGSGDAVLVRCGRQVLTGVKRLGRRPDTGDIAVAVPMRMEAP